MGTRTRAVFIPHSSESPVPPQVYVAWRLVGASPQSPIERINCQGHLIAKFNDLVPETANVTIELRYVVRPQTRPTRQAPRVEVFLIAGVSDRICDLPGLRDEAAQFGQQMEYVLEVDTTPASRREVQRPAFRFHPLSSAHEIARALDPFPVRDLYDIRPSAQQIQTASLFPGTPAADLIVAHMLRQDKPTLLTVGIQDAPIDDASPGNPALVDAISRFLPSYMDAERIDADAITCDLAQACEISAEQLMEINDMLRWRRLREADLRHRAYRARIQVAAAGAVGRALLSTLKTEFGGPGHETIELALSDSGLPLTAPATCGKPRNTVPGRRDHRQDHDHPQGFEHECNEDRDQEESFSARAQRSELAIAVDNLHRLNFEEWGPSLDPRLAPYVARADLATLASRLDFSTATRIFMLPQHTPWLPEEICASAARVG